MWVDLPHTCMWQHMTGSNPRGDRAYADPVEIPCRIERRSRFEEGEGTSQYTKILVGADTLGGVADQLDLEGSAEGEGEYQNVDDFQDQVDMGGEVVGRIVYLASGSRQ